MFLPNKLSRLLIIINLTNEFTPLFSGLIARWHYFDHAAHLGGILLGIWYCHYGYKYIWENREPIMTW